MEEDIQNQTPQPVIQPLTTQETASQPPVILDPPRTPETQPKLSKKLLILIILLVLLVIGTALAYFLLKKQKDSSDQAPSKSTAQVQVPTPQTPSPYTNYQTINLTDVIGSTSSGTATRSIIPEHVFISVSVNLTNPSEGKFYQAWLSNNQGNFVLIGQLMKSTDSLYTAVSHLPAPSFTSFSKVLYNKVLVTSESTDDAVPETTLLEGIFTK